MNYIIADGSTVNIEVGMKVTINPDYVPACFPKNTEFPISEVTPSYPYVHFYHESEDQDDDGLPITKVDIDETSAVTPKLITGVITS